MTQQLLAVRAQHARVREHHGAHFLHALIDVEEHDEKDERHAERDLRPDAQAEPQCKNRRQHHAGQRVRHFDVGVEDGRGARLPREPEADQRAADRADDEGEDRFEQRYPEMFPDDAAGEPGRDLRRHVDGI